MEIQREKTYKANIDMIELVNQDGISMSVSAIPENLELLSSHPDGKFEAIDKLLTGSDVLCGLRAGDELTVTKIRYSGGSYVTHHSLSFDEYVEIGRPKRISVKNTLIFTPLD